MFVPVSPVLRCAALWALAVLAKAEEGEDVKGPMITNKAPNGFLEMQRMKGEWMRHGDFM